MTQINEETTVPAQAEITAPMLEDALTAQAQEDAANEETQAQAALEQRVREGIGELFEDGWSAQELTDFACDPGARADIARGCSVARAACAYLRARAARPVRKQAVPTARRAMGEPAGANPIDRMSDEQFDAFSRRVKAEMMAGRKVRI